MITERPVPVGITYGHTKAETTGEVAPVENEDIATFIAAFAGGFIGTFSASRVSHANPGGLSFDVFGTKGSASWALERASKFHISTTEVDEAVNGRRRVIVGPQHPYITGRLPMDAGGGHGKAEFFAYQPARSWTRSQASASSRLPSTSRTVCAAWPSSPPSPNPPQVTVSRSRSER